MAKTDEMRIRVESDEKQDFKRMSKSLGFESLSAYVLFLLRNEIKSNSAKQ